MSGKSTPKLANKRLSNKADCKHTAVEYKGSVYHIHDNHLYQLLGDQWHKAVIEISISHPKGCTNEFNEKSCWAHDNGEVCGPGCGHEPVQHGDHIDYLVPDHNGGFELHCPHDNHCDHHGHIQRHNHPS